MTDQRPKLNPRRLTHLMQQAVKRCRLDLSWAVVLTEGATGAYVTPVLGALAGAEHVVALTHSIRHSSVEEVMKQPLDLAERGVATGVHYPTPVPFQPAYAHLGHKPGDFPLAEEVTWPCLSLPMFPEMIDEQIDQAGKALRELAAQPGA
jgi:dTDP-4-amino-4,6-dideoxygalactose transaminase